MTPDLTAIYHAATLVKATRFPSPAKDPRQASQQWGMALEIGIGAELEVFKGQLNAKSDVASMIQAPTPEAVAAAMASHT
jgi:hypothetical protein